MFTHLTHLYNPVNLKVVEINGIRYYISPNGSYLTSVTSVIGYNTSHKYDSWAKKIGLEESEIVKRKAAYRGTMLHESVEKLLLNQEVTVNHPLIKYIFPSISKKLKESLNNIHALEIPLYSEKLRIAGRVDCIAEWNGKLSVIDFKTSTKEKKREWIDGYIVQTTTYALMFYEMFGVPIKNVVIIVLCDDGEIQVFEEEIKTEYVKTIIEYTDNFYKNHEQKRDRTDT